MCSFKLLYSFMEVDNAVEKREYLSCKSGNVAHRPIVSVDYSQDVVEPGRMDQRPGHEWQEWYLGITCKSLLAQLSFQDLTLKTSSHNE